MAFDVYVGTMTRFYRREWENAAQRMAREQGIEHFTVYAGGEPPPPPSKQEVREVISGWCAALSGSLSQHGVGPIAWDEGDEQPYFTDRPAWDGYGGMLVWAAHAEHPDLPLPRELPEWAEDEAFTRSTSKEFRSRYGSILRPGLWLPADFSFAFDAPTVASDEPETIASVFELKRQLDKLLEESGAQLERLKAQESSSPSKPMLAGAAAFAIGIFHDLAGKACEHRLPMILDF